MLAWAVAAGGSGDGQASGSRRGGVPAVAAAVAQKSQTREVAGVARWRWTLSVTLTVVARWRWPRSVTLKLMLAWAVAAGGSGDGPASGSRPGGVPAVAAAVAQKSQTREVAGVAR